MQETFAYVAAHLFEIRDQRKERQPFDIADNDMLCVGDGVIAVQTPRAAGLVPVFVEVLGSAPGEAPARFARVTEASIEVTGGKLRVEGEDNDVSLPPLEIPLANGSWTVRVLYAHEDTCTYDDDDGAEHYMLQLYPGATEARELRQAERPEMPVRTAGTTSIDALRSALKSNDPSERASAAVELARSEQFDDVVRTFGTDPSPGVRLAAAGALRLMGNPASLIGAAERFAPSLREAEAIFRRSRGPFSVLDKGSTRLAEQLDDARGRAHPMLDRVRPLLRLRDTALWNEPQGPKAETWLKVGEAFQHLERAVDESTDPAEILSARAALEALVWPSDD
jgi:hypothetical protein